MARVGQIIMNEDLEKINFPSEMSVSTAPALIGIKC